MEVVAVFQNFSNDDIASVINQWLATCLVTTAYHPLLYSRTLFVIGYEPFPPEEYHLWGFKWLFLPNTIQNLSYIKSVDGFFGLYRGLVPTLLAKSSFFITNRVLKDLIPKPRPCLRDIEEFPTACGLKSRTTGFNFLLKGVMREFVIYVGGIVLSHPFRVVAVRMMAQFVGRETKFSSTCASLINSYKSEGLMGLYVGLVPTILGAFISFWSFTVLVSLGQQFKMKYRSIFGLYSDVAKGVAFWLAHPMEVVTNTLVVNNCGLAIGTAPHTEYYPNWISIFHHLYANGQLFRGVRNFGRVYSGPAVSNNGVTTPAGFHFGPVHSPLPPQLNTDPCKPSEQILQLILPARLISRGHD
ncbi:unnamed protein product [Allacma fusca]|uniref:Uncharacterized protein n=1 Tax=Allacma fusca TaxID=39272 RepID=A0A8J2LH51_9HEXA|nr:unnamed protein product [Allacma fusca]